MDCGIAHFPQLPLEGGYVPVSGLSAFKCLLTVVIFQGAALYTYGGRDGCELVPKNETFSQWKNLKVLAAFLLGLNRSFPGILALQLDSSYHHDFTMQEASF